MVSIVGLAAWAAALGLQTAREVDKIGQGVDGGKPGPVEDTNLVEESRTALEGKHEAESLEGLPGRNADSVGEGSNGESTAAVETLEDLADEVFVAETAAAGSAGSAAEVEGEIVAPGSQIVASMKVCRWGERSACHLWSELWEAYIWIIRQEWIL